MEKKLKILVLTSGSRGDIQPLLALSIRLKSLGHEIIFGASKNFENWVKNSNLTYQEFGSDIQKIAEDNAEIVGGKPIKLLRFILALIQNELDLQYNQLLELIKGVDIVIGSSIQLSADFVTKGFNIPYFYFVYAPPLLYSKYHPPITIPFDISNTTINKFLWVINDKLWNLAVKKQCNDYRKKLNLPPLENFLDPLRDGGKNIILASPSDLSPLPKDISEKISQTSTLYHFTDEKIPVELESFLDDDKPIVYVGFGSMTDPNPEKTTDFILDTIKKAEVKIVLSKGWANLGNKITNNSEIIVVGDVSHHLFFNKLSAVVHHGGAGTTGTTALAGTPQIIIPHLLDQYYWAKRIKNLSIGVGSFNKNKLNSENLSKAIKEVVQNKEFKANALDLRKKLLVRDGIEKSIKAITDFYYMKKP